MPPARTAEPLRGAAPQERRLGKQSGALVSRGQRGRARASPVPRDSSKALRARGFRISVLQRERESRDSINIYVGRNISRLEHQIKPRRMKYDHRGWIKPLESLGRFKSSLVWKRGSLVFSSVSMPLMAFPRAWSVRLLLKINHSGRLRQPFQCFRCSELKKRRKSHEKRKDEALRRAWV